MKTVIIQSAFGPKGCSDKLRTQSSSNFSETDATKSSPALEGILRGTIPSLVEKAMAPHSSTLAWKIPWMEEPGRLQSMGLLRVGHD